MLQVFCWSMRCLASGSFPTCRHDGTPWLKSDAERAKFKGSIPRALLLQVRADWAWKKQVFDFPSWAAKNICWKCGANDSDCNWRDVSKRAKWRLCRWTDKVFFAKQRENGIAPCPIFSLPGFRLVMVCIGVLHALDLGVSQDLEGNVLWEYLTKFAEGRTLKVKVEALWDMLRAHYQATRTANRVQTLTLEMVKQDKKGPKMRTKGAETRGLMPFAVEVAMLMHEQRPNDYTKTVLMCTSAMFDFYMLMSMSPYNAKEGADACRKFCLLYKALNDQQTNPLLWRMKPKVHMFQELAEYSAETMGNPATFWNYKDEDFVGWVAKLARARVGPKQGATTAKAVFSRYRAMCNLGA